MQTGKGRGTGKWPVIMSCAVLALASATAWAAAGPVRILAHESFRPLAPASTPGVRKPDSGSIAHLKFDAYGRRFDVVLEKNTRLAGLIAAPDSGPTFTLYQGALANMPGSWARLSAKAQVIRGMIWDGSDLYVIDSAAVLGDAAAGTAPDDAIIFRLADTQVEPGIAFCGTDSGTGKAAYAALMSELKSSVVIQRAPGAALRLELSIVGDDLFTARYASDQQAREEILTRLNNVDGIYSSQLGIELQASTLTIEGASGSQLSRETNASKLIEELGTLRSQTPTLRARGLTHLFTGRELDDTTVGIAYTGGLCSSRYGAGLTQVSRSAGIDALITAHEIGHNFGAVHDGSEQCASTPVNQFIMSPSVSQSATTFSQCSLDTIRPRLQSAACLLPMAPPDLSIPQDLDTQVAAINAPFEWSLTVSNVGGSTAERARVTLLVPPVVAINDAWVAGGTCTSNAGFISCEMGDIAVAGTRVIHLTLQSSVAGSNSISAEVSA
ncbi:MAG TPA: M12 family metallo-peptidase, partial [Povalibacter sp.]|nr:M12 family metallo-peptidase [Povalibacter sp.]